MMCFGRSGPLFGLFLAAVAAAAVIVAAALTTWWVLLARIPLGMLVGCMAMMATMARMRPGTGMAGQWGCCAGGRPPYDRG